MGHGTDGLAKRIICPSCKASIVLRSYRNDLLACPRCGDWLDVPSPHRRRPARIEYEPKTDFEEGDDWERDLRDRLG